MKIKIKNNTMYYNQHLSTKNELKKIINPNYKIIYPIIIKITKKKKTDSKYNKIIINPNWVYT